MIVEADLVERTRELVAIPSVTGDEAAVAVRLAERCEEIGLETALQVVQPGRSNVIARLAGGPGPSVLFTGHMDVVPPGDGWTRDPFDPVVEGGRIYGRGTADMKGGLAAMLEAMRAFVATGERPAGDLYFVAVVGEEEDQAGTAHLVAEGFAADLAIVGEPTDAKIVRGHKGCVAYRITVRGVAAHASVPSAGVNAIDHAADVVVALRGIARRLAEHPDPDFGPATISVGTITGGIRPYVVPDRCVLEVDRRLVPGETVQTAVDEATAAIALASGDRPVDGTVDVLVGALPFAMPADHELVMSAQAALAYHNAQPEVLLWPAVSDASILANDAGIATILLGPGSIAHAAHKPDESVAVRELSVCASTYLHLMGGVSDH